MSERTRPRIARSACCAALLVLLGACAAPMRATPPEATFVVVRHAEKATDDPRDPNLSEAGTRRAGLLADRLRDANLMAAYATQYRRTQQTAATVAATHALPVTRYEADEPATALAARLRSTHQGGTVLVVGHSNTVPAIVQALCACEVQEIGDDDYGNLYRIEPGSDGAPRLQHSRY